MGNCQSQGQQEPTFLSEAKTVPQFGSVNVLSFNMFVRPPMLNNNGDDFKDERLDEFLKIAHSYDIICLQEMFQSYSKRHGSFIKRATEAGFLFHATSPKIKTLSLYFIDGGLLVLSRYPIIETEFFTFPAGIGVDYFVQKGVLYAKIRIGNTILHIFNSHTQANYKDKLGCFLKKTEQFIVFQKFVNETLQKHEYKKGDMVLLMGDLNIDGNSKLEINHKDLALLPIQHNLKFDESKILSEYETLIACLSANNEEEIRDLLFVDSGSVHPVTFGDCYTSVANEVLPTETALTVKHSLCTMQSLDYIFQYIPKVLLSKSEKANAEPSEKLIVVNGGTQVEKFLIHDRPFTQLSDHYGVKTTLQYKTKKNDNNAQPKQNGKVSKNLSK